MVLQIWKRFCILKSLPLYFILDTGERKKDIKGRETASPQENNNNKKPGYMTKTMHFKKEDLQYLGSTRIRLFFIQHII